MAWHFRYFVPVFGEGAGLRTQFRERNFRSLLFLDSVHGRGAGMTYLSLMYHQILRLNTWAFSAAEKIVHPCADGSQC